MILPRPPKQSKAGTSPRTPVAFFIPAESAVDNRPKHVSFFVASVMAKNLTAGGPSIEVH